MSSDEESIFDWALDHNDSFHELPKPYQKFIYDEPLDVVLDTNKVRLERINAMKYGAHLNQNNLYREVVLIKKLDRRDTIIEPIRLDIYPSNRKDLERKYLTFYKINSLRYSYNGSNFLVARQILPNIEITKIVPYTKNWQTAILEVDNDILTKIAHDSRYRDRAMEQDSLLLGLNNKKSVYDFLFEKELLKNAIPYLSIADEHKEIDVLTVSEEKKLRLISIPDDISFWNSLTQLKKVPDVRLINLERESIISRLKAYTEGLNEFKEVFDIEKLSGYYALLNLYSNRIENSLYLNLNENTGLLEPLYVDKNLGESNTYLKNLQIQDITFLQRYAEQLRRFANLNGTKAFIDEYTEEIKKLLEVVHQTEPAQLFDIKLFVHNKLIIEKALNPSTSTKISLLHHDQKQLEVEVENLTNFPTEIAELSYQQKKLITGPRGENHVVMPLQKQKVIFDLPDSFDNLFVHKKKKTTGFTFEKDIFNLAIGYRLAGTFDMKYNTITPFKDLDELKEEDLFRKEESLIDFDFISIDEDKREISFNIDSIVLNKPLVFPAGYTVKADPGLHIDVLKGGKIMSKSPLRFIGSEEKPIRIYSSDRRGQGIFVVSAKDTSKLKHVEFDYLTNQAHGLWDLTGAVVFYESPVNLDHVLVANNSCEDGLNIIRTNFTMKNTRFLNTQSDAFDGDFVQGTLMNCSFENLGNDAVDVSGSTLEMYGLSITNAGDKALSAGEDSQMKAEGLVIDKSEIAIAGKDLSIVKIQDATITNSKLGFTAFQKKPEFGASDIEAKNVVMKNVETTHLIENKSSLLLNGEQVETIEAVKEQMYGVEFGVDSKDTRVKKTQ